jgi:DinB superfamily
MGAMSIPAASPDFGPRSTIFALFRQVHQQLRDELYGLDDETLNWVPTPGANSMATIVRHLVGSEAETLRCVAGVACERDRGAEFAGSGLTGEEVLRLLKDADDLIGELEPRIGVSHLSAELPLPTLPPDEVRTGLTWLIGNYGHAREHLGQIQITRQICTPS